MRVLGVAVVPFISFFGGIGSLLISGALDDSGHHRNLSATFFWVFVVFMSVCVATWPDPRKRPK